MILDGHKSIYDMTVVGKHDFNLRDDFDLIGVADTQVLESQQKTRYQKAEITLT